VQDHDPVNVPHGAVFTSIGVPHSDAGIAIFQTNHIHYKEIEHVYIIIHGKLRNGGDYWQVLNDAIQGAKDAGYPGTENNSIAVAPQFFSEKYNSGQYKSTQLAWDDLNGWEAGDAATHPPGTRVNSIDAIDAIVVAFARQHLPQHQNLTVVGHGGGGQLSQRDAVLAADPPTNVHVRYVHGDPSSCAYFTSDRPKVKTFDVPSKKDCPYYNTWRYGFDGFPIITHPSTSNHDYFKQYITRDVVSIVGYKDVTQSGDQCCMANMQGGNRRRNRNLTWYKYVNMLARTDEDLIRFPGEFDDCPDWSDISHNKTHLRLVVVENADHNASEVFSSREGRSALFSSGDVETGWRP
jgi:pimeloyl-ACP methyl ester carboxylesterase